MDDCIVWPGRKDKDGYGRISTCEGPRRAHRLVYEGIYGPIPKGLRILHSCDNPGCVNPAHLRAGTEQENKDDMVARNRQARGSKCGRSKLLEEEVVVIKMRLANGDHCADIARDYNVSLRSIQFIKSGKFWGWLNPPA